MRFVCFSALLAASGCSFLLTEQSSDAGENGDDASTECERKVV